MNRIELILATSVTVGIIGVGITLTLGYGMQGSLPPQPTPTVTDTKQGSETTIPSASQMNATLMAESQLSFQLLLNSTSLANGQGITVTTQLVNLEEMYNNVSSGSNWVAENLRLEASVNCGTENLPLGLAIIQGHYAANNITSASSLYLWNPTLPNPGCPPFPARTYSYLFSPSSNLAVPNPSSLPGSPPQYMEAAFNINGYWTGTGFNTGVFHQFAPGVYTVFAADEWGEELFLYFIVN